MPIDIKGYQVAAGLKMGASNTKIAIADYGISDPMLPAMYGAVTSGGSIRSNPYPVNDVNTNIGRAGQPAPSGSPPR